MPLPLSQLSTFFRRILSSRILFIVGLTLLSVGNSAAQVLPKVSFGIEKTDKVEDIAVTLQIVFLLTILSLAPSIIIMMTSFTRIVIVLNFLKQALASQNAPPNQMVMGLGLFLTFFIMAPTFTKMNDEALQPYLEKKIDYKEALERGKIPIRNFMLRQTREEELALFVRVSRAKNPATIDDIPMTVLIPAFILSELKTAFIIGFLIYIPFLVIDMTVASVLMSMGMMMLPPVMISLPFKLILFVLVDGWKLVVQQVILSFN